MSGRQLRQLRTDVQMVFQDPNAALNPSMTIETAVGHPLKIHGIASGEELHRRVAAALERVGLAPAEQFLDKYPADLSGGQKQRAVIARAIILDPEVLVADEPVSMLDMSVRAKILQLMLDLKHDLDLTYVYITHDLATAKFFCDRVAIMYLGRIVEIGPTEEIFAEPRHPYTKALLQAIPEPDPNRSVPRELPRGEIPDAARPPAGCSFHPRCPAAVAECGWESRDLRVVLEQHWLRAEPDVFTEERELTGDLDHLDDSTTDARLGSGPRARAVAQLLERIRAENPDEPLWRGVDEVVPEADGVHVRFHPGVDPALRRAGGVEVACVLYPETDPATVPPRAT
jgi:oligopeptide/dipeptide ABC transporter ATP-binding protein